MNTLSNVESNGGYTAPLIAERTACLIPDATNTESGVSVRYAPNEKYLWFIFRVSYGREDKALRFIINNGIYAYVPKRYAYHTANGKKTRILKSLIPNLVFAYTTKEQAEIFVKKTPSFPYLSYYYNHFELNPERKNPPLTVSRHEMENFILATCSMNEHLRFVNETQCHFKGGELVRVTDGVFKGVEGRVARVAGQQRVIVSLKNIGLVSTAYIPTAFISIIKK